jgi:hypothetical protein
MEKQKPGATPVYVKTPIVAPAEPHKRYKETKM